MFLPGPYMLWWPALRASHPLRTPEAEEPLKSGRIDKLVGAEAVVCTTCNDDIPVG